MFNFRRQFKNTAKCWLMREDALCGSKLGGKKKQYQRAKLPDLPTATEDIGYCSPLSRRFHRAHITSWYVSANLEI